MNNQYFISLKSIRGGLYGVHIWILGTNSKLSHSFSGVPFTRTHRRSSVSQQFRYNKYELKRIILRWQYDFEQRKIVKDLEKQKNSKIKKELPRLNLFRSLREVLMVLILRLKNIDTEFY